MTRDRVAKVGRRVLLGTALIAGLLASSVVGSTPASARAFFSVGVGLPMVAPPPPYYYYPPEYYAPTYYYAPPVYAAPAPAYAPQPAAAVSHDYCREYQSTQVINGQPQNVVGTACRQPDGSWRIVQ
ncbi:MAG TPA: hypothetical protein VNT30_08455 [Stellaceae bacterium]|nr:hypothetical protein [Stellaceae bacterium]